MPHIETSMVDQSDEHGLRRRSSQIISADASLNKEVNETQSRPREDSITAFKKYGKTFIYNDNNNI